MTNNLIIIIILPGRNLLYIGRKPQRKDMGLRPLRLHQHDGVGMDLRKSGHRSGHTLVLQIYNLEEFTCTLARTIMYQGAVSRSYR